MPNHLRVNDTVMIPRTGGGYSKGTIIAIDGDIAITSFPVGRTYRGQPNTDIPGNTMAQKKVPLKDLIAIQEVL